MDEKRPVMKPNVQTGGCKAPERPKAMQIKSNKEKSEILKQYFKKKEK